MAVNPAIIRKGRLGLLMTPRYNRGLGISVIDLNIEDFMCPRFGLVYPLSGLGMTLIDYAGNDNDPLINEVLTHNDLRLSASGRFYFVSCSEGEGQAIDICQNSLPAATATYIVTTAHHPNLEGLNVVVAAAKKEEDINEALATNFLTEGRFYTWFTISDLVEKLQQLAKEHVDDTVEDQPVAT